MEDELPEEVEIFEPKKQPEPNKTPLPKPPPPPHHKAPSK